MNSIKYGLRFLSLILLILANHIYASTVEEQLKANIVDSNFFRPMCNKNSRCRSALTKQFYVQNNAIPIWVQDNHIKKDAESLIAIIKDSYKDGINSNNYTLDNVEELITEYNNSKESSDRSAILANLDASLTDLFFQYANTLVYGQINIKEVYPTWNINKHSIDLIAKLNEINKNNINDIVNSLLPTDPQYQKLKDKLAIYQQIVINGGWKTIPNGPKLKLGDKSKRVQLLQERLLITGELNSIKQKGVFDKSLKKAVMLFQKSHGIYPDGIVGQSTLQALNVSAEMRTRQIELNMERIRLLPNDLGRKYILVNIPDYSLAVFDDNKMILSMPVIVGRDQKLQSCVLSSAIRYVDFNPYWYIPNSIAIKEILPKLKRDPKYLYNHNMEVFTNYGTPPIDPTTIDWKSISESNFSYKFRQIPSESNPLGQVKFIFPNSCGIYLHDTSDPELFKHSKRAFSHGCIRIGKPIDLATYLLSDKSNWTRDQILSTIKTGKNKAIYLSEPINIYIVYQTAWVNESGILQFRNDIYNIDSVAYTLVNKPVNAK